MKVKILTDTSCGILRKEAESLGYEMIALPFVMDDKEYDDDTISSEDFYKNLLECKDIHTSQASIEKVLNYWDRLLEENDLIIYLPITSGLSSSYSSAYSFLSDEKYKDKVIIIDHKTISILQREMLKDIKNMLDKGIDVRTIKERVEANAKNNRIYITVDNLEYLKKGGRVSPLVATFGNLLNIKPILFSNGNSFDMVKKARGLKSAEEDIKNLVMNDINTMFKDIPKEKIAIGVAYTECIDEAKKFKASIDETFNVNATMDELPFIIGCHIGAGAVAAAIYIHVDGN